MARTQAGGIGAKTERDEGGGMSGDEAKADEERKEPAAGSTPTERRGSNDPERRVPRMRIGWISE